MNLLPSTNARTFFATVLFAAAMALTGCSADALSGPDLSDPGFRSDRGFSVEGMDRGTWRADSKHGNNGGGSINRPAGYNDDCEVDPDSCMDAPSH